MKYGWVVLLLCVGVIPPRAAQAQVSVYGEFSASTFTNLIGSHEFYGGTAGVLYDGPKIFGHVVVAADIQGRFLNHNSNLYNGLTVGPRFEVPLRRGWTPYGEFLVGFARLRDNEPNCSCDTTGTTDGTLEVNAGLAKAITPYVDGVVAYSYAQYYAFGGQFNPKTASLGVVVHFKRREMASQAKGTTKAVPYAKPLPADVR